ncbi:inovirus-type Gp2 protein [Acinetobacter lactucae]|uniref:YagK/YfjJ domain-containing protein n=1 Tax=Acinetobacter calcoaceticus/baumannii complex TaxID=909768 RepID=UPI0039F6AE27
MSQQAQTLIAIESFIERIRNDQITNDQILRELQELIPAFHIQYCSNVWYSQHIQVFIGLIHLVEGYLQGQSYDGLDMLLEHQVVTLRKVVQNNYSTVLNERHAFQLQELNNQKRLIEYIQCVLQQKSRSLIVRVDLKYPEPVQDLVNIQLFDHHMKVLRNRISNGDRCFSDLEGYVWALEQGGYTTGFHCHLMLIYDAHKHQSDFGLALAVGNYWKEITNGLGSFYTPNDRATKARFEEQGTLALGRIERANPQQCQNVVAYVTYFAQPEKYHQRLRVKLRPGSRTFGTGQ